MFPFHRKRKYMGSIPRNGLQRDSGKFYDLKTSLFMHVVHISLPSKPLFLAQKPFRFKRGRKENLTIIRIHLRIQKEI